MWYAITNPMFINTDHASSIVSCNAKFNSGDGKKLTSSLRIEFTDDRPFVFEFKDIIIDDVSSLEDVILYFERPVVSDIDLGDRLNDLKELIEG